MLRKRPVIPLIYNKQLDPSYRPLTPFKDLPKETRAVLATKWGMKGAKPEKKICDLTDEELLQHGEDLKKSYEEIELYSKTIKRYDKKFALGVWNNCNNSWKEEMKKRGLM